MIVIVTQCDKYRMTDVHLRCTTEGASVSMNTFIT